MHTDKIWGLDSYQSETEPLQIITGGGDAYIKLWRDDTTYEDLR